MHIIQFNLKNKGLLLGNIRFNPKAFKKYCTNKKCSTIYSLDNIFNDKRVLSVKEDFINVIRLFLNYQQI